MGTAAAGNFYGVYRLTETHVDSATFATALYEALLRYEKDRKSVV